MNRPVTRLTSVDAVRGAVMVIMALDHVREFVHADAMVFNAEDLTRTDPASFLTRWITHLCAPAFVFLAGVAAERQLQRHGSRAALSRQLLTRGIWLVILELTVMRLALNFRMSSQDPWLLIILCAIGLSMIALAGLIHLPWRVVGGIGVAIVVLHNLLDPIRARDLGALAPLWTVLHEPGVVMAGGTALVIGYPVLPWLGVMAVGFASGRLFDLPPERRQRLLVTAGVSLVAFFVLLRGLNSYGDPSPWATQPSSLMTALSFLRTTKYPPSLQFLAMTLGPLLLALAWAERRHLPTTHSLVALGRVPLFYYIGHFLLAHLVASLLFTWQYGFTLAFLSGPFPSMGGARDQFPAGFGHPLWVVYVVWLGVVLAMLPLCRAYGRIKAARGGSWLRFL